MRGGEGGFFLWGWVRILGGEEVVESVAITMFPAPRYVASGEAKTTVKPGRLVPRQEPVKDESAAEMIMRTGGCGEESLQLTRRRASQAWVSFLFGCVRAEWGGFHARLSLVDRSSVPLSP